MAHSQFILYAIPLPELAESNKVSNIYIHLKQVKITTSSNYLVNLRVEKELTL